MFVSASAALKRAKQAPLVFGLRGPHMEQLGPARNCVHGTQKCVQVGRSLTARFV